MDNIQHQENNGKGIFFVLKDGKKEAEMTYRFSGHNLISIDHTQVSESLKGTGAATSLIEAAVSFARSKNLKINPQCSFARAQFKRHGDWKDVLEEEEKDTY